MNTQNNTHTNQPNDTPNQQHELVSYSQPHPPHQPPRSRLAAIVEFRRTQQDLEARLAFVPRSGAHKHDLKRPLTLLKMVENQSISKIRFQQANYFGYIEGK